MFKRTLAMQPNNTQPTEGRPRRQFTPEQKTAILREHLLEGKTISDVCAAHAITPAMFYQWQRQLFENGAAAFNDRRPRSHQVPGQEATKVAKLEAKLQQKDAVIGDIMIELMAVKKSLGEA
jgi:transposase